MLRIPYHYTRLNPRNYTLRLGYYTGFPHSTRKHALLHQAYVDRETGNHLIHTSRMCLSIIVTFVVKATTHCSGSIIPRIELQPEMKF